MFIFLTKTYKDFQAMPGPLKHGVYRIAYFLWYSVVSILTGVYYMEYSWEDAIILATLVNVASQQGLSHQLPKVGSKFTDRATDRRS